MINKKQYLDILGLINYNWISNYIIKFDDNSNAIYTKQKEKIQNLEYLTSNLLQKESKINNNNNITKNNGGDINDDAYWYLKYLFNHKYIPVLKSSEIIKKLIFDILKYTHPKKKPNVSHIY